MAIVKAALKAADAAVAVRTHLSVKDGVLDAGSFHCSLRDFDRVFALAVGKAAVPMAAVVEAKLGRHLTAALAVTKPGHATLPLRNTRVFESSHPIPDQRGLQAASAAIALLRELNARDLLIVCVSGGASALLPAPQPPVTLAEKQRTTDLLLRSGANIAELNCVRKHLSRLKGGRLAALAYPATVLSLVLSDVIGDPLDVIGSGLTAPDETTFADALDVLGRYELLSSVPKPVRLHLESGSAANARVRTPGEPSDTPKPGDLAFRNVHNVIVGSNRLALAAARAKAIDLGYNTVVLSSTLSGETREVAGVHAAILREITQTGSPAARPACLLSGGETTVTVRGQGKGGRNQEFTLAAALHIASLPDVLVLSFGTDGTDGPTDAAGAYANGATVERAQALGLGALAHLQANDAYPFFDLLDNLIKTGPTGTNVMDIHLLLAL